MKNVLLAVIGSAAPDAEVERLAEEAGRAIARRGGVLICGGLGGVMAAAARGAKSAGGLTIGILPTYRAEDANAFIDIPVCTGLGHARNVVVAATGQAVIAISGSLGTLSEIAMALKLGKPVVALGSWRLDEGRLPRGARYVLAKGPREAVDLAFQLAEQGRSFR